MPSVETPEQVASLALRVVRDALRRAGRTSVRVAEDIDGLRMTLGAKESPETVEDNTDLPDSLRRSRPATRRVYRILREMRAEGANARVMPADIEARFAADDATAEPSVDTINHALRDLRDRELAYSHPDRGWVLGREQIRLPFPAGQSETPSPAAAVAHTPSVACDSRTRFKGGASVFSKSYIWVPAERSEYGVAVTDAASELTVVAGERLGEMKVVTRSGRIRSTPAVRGELLRVEGKLAVVRLPGGAEVRTRVLGDWHLAGLTEPAPEPATTEAGAA